MARVLDDHIEITPGMAGGKPRIAGRQITVQNIAIWHELMGKSADEIATEMTSPWPTCTRHWPTTLIIG